METINSNCPSCCVSCKHWVGGEGDRACLKCKDIETLIPSMETSRKKHVYMPYPPEEKTRPNYDNRIDTIDRMGILSPLQFGVLCDYHNKMSWGDIGNKYGMCRQNAKRTFKRAIRRVSDEEKSRE